MAKIKSLGLEGAKRAVRKLFGRQASTAGSSSIASGASNEAVTVTGADIGTGTTKAAAGTSNHDGHLDGDGDGEVSKGNANLINNHNSADTEDRTSPSTSASKDAIHQAEASVNTNTEAKDKEDKQKEDKTASIGDDSSSIPPPHPPLSTDQTDDTLGIAPQNNLAASSTMFAPVQEHVSSMQQKDNAQDGKPPAMLEEPGSNKENQPPLGSAAPQLTSGMEKLGLEDPADAAEEEAPDTIPYEALTEEEKALQAEREKHLVFIEEALDMVGWPYSVFFSQLPFPKIESLNLAYELNYSCCRC